MRKLLSFILILMCPLFISFILPPPAKADTLFYDNFDDGNPDGWKTYDNGTGIKNLWKVEKINQNYMYGITIDINYAQTWAVAGEFSWSDYIYEVEILPISGTDKNIIWRVKDPNHFYALHMRGNLIGIRKIGSNPGNYWPADVNYTVLNGIKYKLIMKSLGKHLQVSISNGNSTVILFDFEDVEEPYLNGAIGLYASTGADRPTSVWFDEVRVEFIENVPHFPLILIPGHGACFNREAIVYGKQETNQEDWKFWPFLHEYDGLIKSIENSGYQLNSDLFLFCYDWRKEIDQTADILKNFISNKVLKNRSDVNRVKIIGHSMGGLIGRTFSQKYYGSGLEQLITVGTPHQGVIQSYYAWEGGQPFGEKNFSWLAWQILIQTQKKGFKTNIETVRETAPSTLNLFPTFNFLKNQNGEEKDIKLMNWKNEWLLNLNQSLPDLFSTKFNSLIGIKGNTPSAFIITQRDWLDEILNRWEDGKPINTEHENGDLTVLEKSATISDLPFSSLNLDHGELIRTKEGIEEILKLLKIPVIKIEEGTKLKLTPSLLFLLGSSGNIEIIGPKSEIYFGEEEKMVLIPNAIGGEYEIKILPENEDKGEFQLFIGQITEDETFWNEIEDTIEGNILTYKINFNPLFPKENPILDDDGIIFLNQAEKRILNLKNKFDDPLLKIILKKIKQCKRLIEENKFSQTGKIIEELINLIFEFRRKNNFPESRNSSYQAITYLGRTFEIVMNNSRKKFDKKDIDLEIKKTQMLLNTAKNTLNKLQKKGKITVNNGVSFEQALENFQKGKKAYSEENLTLAKILLFIVQSLAKESILI